MNYNEEYTDLLNSSFKDNINIGNSDNKIGDSSIQVHHLNQEVLSSLSFVFIAQYQSLGTSLFTHDGAWHTLDLSSYIGSGVKTVLFNMTVSSDDDGDDFRFANPDNHDLACELFVDVNIDGVINYTDVSGVLIATTNEAGEIDYLSDSDNTQVLGKILGYWNSKIN